MPILAVALAIMWGVFIAVYTVALMLVGFARFISAPFRRKKKAPIYVLYPGHPREVKMK